ncbi:peptide ABC transporter permease [Alicyclobacillus cellulosilyticus]|uniref:Peptide ABC transporter permease n=1 Tax=Alicyclobacillus cellulosilyticus TaxID=1003997 RepID=A0A917K8G5_9BACL|nr:peptide ABC transporter permease [Alicyclobacillus cellulosilyticus]
MVQAQQMAQQLGISLPEAYRRIQLLYHINPNEPLYKQFLSYVQGLLHGNLGTSMVNQQVTVNQVIAAGVPWTLFVASIALLTSFVIGNWIGVRMAWKRNSWLDPLMTVFNVISHAVPSFIIALLLLEFFALDLQWFPFNGAYDTSLTPGFNWPFIGSVLRHAFLPILTYVLVLIGGQAMSMKSTSLAVMNEDYVTAAIARGLRERTIVKDYIRRIAILPQVTGLALAFGGILGASSLVETLFSYPGIGQYLVQATNNRDYTELQGLFLFQSFCLIVANLIANILYAKLDPRVRIEE